VKVTIISHGVTDQSLLGGPGRVAAQHAKGLAARGHKVYVITTNLVWKGRRESRPTFELVERAGVSIHCATAYSASWWPGSLGPVVTVGAKAILRDAIRWADVVHAHEWPHSFVQTARSIANKYDKPFLIQPHGSIQVRNIGWRRAMHSAFNLRYRVGPRDAFIAGSVREIEEIKTVLRTNARIYKLANPMPVTIVTPEDPQVTVRRASWNCPAGSRILLYAHRIAPNKGLDIGIRALQSLDESYHLIVVGEESGYARFAKECKDLARSLGVDQRVRFMGAVGRTEVDEVIMAADLFLLPARRDTFPLMVLHALSCGRPVVVTSGCQSVDELEGAVVVAEAEPRSLADAITSLTPVEVQRHVEAGRVLIAERYSPASVARDLERIYNDRSVRTGG
jgi:glycosyltransferase involved in cell wall biosynthesis